MDVCSGRPDRAVSCADNGKFSGSKSSNDESGKEFKRRISALQVAPKSAVQIGGVCYSSYCKSDGNKTRIGMSEAETT